MENASMLDELKNKQSEILKGELAALLHDIGKCHPNFLLKQSFEGGEDFPHGNIDEFLDANFVSHVIKDSNFKFSFPEECSSDLYSIITKHHEKEKKLNDLEKDLVMLIQACDRMDSADDKGIVRRKQSKDNIVIDSPFGCRKERINIDYLQYSLDQLVQELTEVFKNYIDGREGLTEFRKSVMKIVRPAFSRVLGETRIPANEVTLWDHSYSTASLYKSVLCSITLGHDPEPNDVQWRLFGICWNGYGFIETSKKVADIQRRKDIIEELKEKLKELLEEEYPIGNVVYEDINGVYFTFPTLPGSDSRNDNEKEIGFAKECAEKVLEKWHELSNDSGLELLPFFTLSKASRSLTTLGGSLRLAAAKRKISKIGSVLFIEDKDKKYCAHYLEKGKLLISFSDINDSGKRDICPVCTIRSKPEKKEMCNVCWKRRQGRLNDWLAGDIQNTIWVDEVADKNNRFALLSLSFGLNNWLDGTMVKTIYSQTFEDWLNDNKRNETNVAKLVRLVNANGWNSNIEPTIKTAQELIEIVKKIVDKKKDEEFEKAAIIFDTFFKDVNIGKKRIQNHWKNITSKLPQDDPPHILATLFTKNPSPARLMRIWRETEEFWEDVIAKIKQYPMWQRLKFKVDCANMLLKENHTYILKFNNLNPDTILVCYTGDGTFITIETLEKFKAKRLNGLVAVQETLRNDGFNFIALENEPETNLLKSDNSQYIKAQEIITEDYHPFIEIIHTPLMFQVIVSACDAGRILDMIISLYNERFAKVIGKLPLNASLLVANRKFPLYIMLEASRRAMQDSEFEKQETMDAWWDIGNLRNEDFYRYYPKRKLEDDNGYTLDDLEPISKGKPFALYPGYFDFELLRGTEDRHRIVYGIDKKRVGGDFRLFSGRPYYLYQFNQMVDLWEILKNNLSSTQINFVEKALTEKIREWRDVEDPAKKCVFRNYAEAVLRDAFAESWDKLRAETRFFLLESVENKLLFDTILLFRHVIKEN